MAHNDDDDFRADLKGTPSGPVGSGAGGAGLLLIVRAPELGSGEAIDLVLFRI